MAERKIKSLYHTGRISRADARVIAEQLCAKKPTSRAKTKTAQIRASTTASGRGAISFHITFPGSVTRSVTNRHPKP